MNYLSDIIIEKKKLVESNRKVLGSLAERTTPRVALHTFRENISKNGLNIIAEIKRKSPSKGVLNAALDPVKQAVCYESGGADAISVLTDFPFFGGTLLDLQQVKAAVHIPILRKDFIVDELQLYETVFSGADAVLLIVAVLGERTEQFLKKAHTLGLDVLVEVHDEAELEIALQAGAPIIGINNRNLSDFTVDLSRGLTMREQIPRSVMTVAESGIVTSHDARLCAEAGFNAILVGETLMRSGDPAKTVGELKGGS